MTPRLASPTLLMILRARSAQRPIPDREAEGGSSLLDEFVTTPRLLVILGSGETSPTMVTPHQQVFAELASGLGEAARAEVPAVALDSPYGFQENADELTERIHDYFADSVGREVSPVRFRSRDDLAADPAGHAEEMARLRAARWIFAGPGSPSYALRTWTDSGVAPALHDRLSVAGGGGAVVFASAAALTLGVVTVPVYEVYKVGEEPRWLDGLDVFGRATGLAAAVIPHFDNTEGGTHDTRYCYLGERRLRRLERELPDATFVLGVDEHTGLIIDLSTGDARVVGRGAVTIRVGEHCTVRPTGSTMTLDDIAKWGGGATRPTEPTPIPSTHDVPSAAQVDALLNSSNVSAAVQALLELLTSGGSDQPSVTALVARVGALAAAPHVDVTATVRPYVELLLRLRQTARDERRFADADAIRDQLEGLGVDVRDTADGATWELSKA
jgi:cyanophycinase-like exopeptidase